MACVGFCNDSGYCMGLRFEEWRDKEFFFLLRATVVGRIGGGNFGVKNIPFLLRVTVVGRIGSGNFGIKNIPFLLRATIRHEMAKGNSARFMKI